MISILAGLSVRAVCPWYIGVCDINDEGATEDPPVTYAAGPNGEPGFTVLVIGMPLYIRVLSNSSVPKW